MGALWEHQGLFIAFNLIVFGMLAVDLGVFNRKAHVISFRSALYWSIAYIAIGLSFGLCIFIFDTPDNALLYVTGYLIEKSLSVDNIFVFIVIFSYFQVEPKYQHKVLFWGIVGALIMRAILISAGIVLIQKFHWIVYVLGVFLIFTGIKAAKEGDKAPDIEKNPLIRLSKKLLPLTKEYHGSSFMIREGKKILFTPLFVVLLVVETTDVVFALDSIPAILAISQDPFIVYTSNVFAILGLRALYFVVADVMGMFRYLKFGICLILVFVGTKMLIQGFYHVPPQVSLSVIASILTISVLASKMPFGKIDAR